MGVYQILLSIPYAGEYKERAFLFSMCFIRVWIFAHPVLSYYVLIVDNKRLRIQMRAQNILYVCLQDLKINAANPDDTKADVCGCVVPCHPYTVLNISYMFILWTL